MSLLSSLASLSGQIRQLFSALDTKVSIPKTSGATKINWAKDARASGDLGYWVQSGTTRSYENNAVGTYPWGHDTKTCAVFTFAGAGNGGGIFRFKPSDGLGATKVTGNLVRMGLEFYVTGATEGTTTVTVTGAWQFATGQVTATLLSSQNVVNKRLVKVVGDYTWPSAGAITAGGTNDFYITVTLTNAPAGCVLRMTNAHIDTTDFFDGNTPDTSLHKYDFATPGSVTTHSIRTTQVAGDGSLFYANDNTFKAVPAPSSITSSSITDFQEAVQDAVNGVLAAGTGVSLAYNDAGNILTITNVGAADAEAIQDAMGVAMIGAGLISVVYNDAANTITISTTATANDTDANLKNRANHTGTQAASTITGAMALANAVPGTEFLCPWNSATSKWQYNGADLNARPSARTDIYFTLVGAPAATANPAWLLTWDGREDV